MAPRAATGPAHVAVVSFLAARAAPTGGFWIALAGGVALARVAERLGARLGFGASAAAMLETVAIIGPARLGVPLTQAISAPMLGRLHARGVGFWPQLLACATVRLLHNAATTAFFIWVITGGLDAYAGTYDAIGRRVGIEVGTADALALTLAGLLAWAALREHGAGAGVPARAAGVGGARARTAARRGCPPRPSRPPPPPPGPIRPAGRGGGCPHCVRSPAVQHRVGVARRRRRLARAGLGALPPGARARACRPRLRRPAGRHGVRVRAGRRARARDRAAARRPGRAARARGHLAACGGARGRAARGFAPRARPAAPHPVRARGRRGARRDRLRGPAGGRRPLACRAALAGAEAAGRHCSTPCSPGWSARRPPTRHLRRRRRCGCGLARSTGRCWRPPRRWCWRSSRFEPWSAGSHRA